MKKQKTKNNVAMEPQEPSRTESSTASDIPRPYETVSAEDFERAVRLTGKQSYETSEVSARKIGIETSFKLPARTASSKRDIAEESEEEDEDVEEEPTLERQLLDFQAAEAKKQIKEENYEIAVQRISDMLENTTMTSVERSRWKVEQAECMQMLGRWPASLELFDQAWADGCGTRYYARGVLCAAEALFQLHEYGQAKLSCSNALRILEKSKNIDEEWMETFLVCVDLMARITEAMGKEVEAAFYRSKAIPGHISKTAALQRIRDTDSPDQVPDQTPKPAAQNRSAVLAEFRLGCRYDEVKNAIVVTDRKEYLSPAALGRFRKAFENALKTNNDWYADCLLNDWEYVRQSKILFYTIAQRSMKYMKLLLKSGIDVNGSIGLSKEAGAPDDPLSIAVAAGNEDAVKYLLANGANVNGSYSKRLISPDGQPIASGTTPLHEAVRRSDLKLLDTLIGAGARRDGLNFRGYTPLHEAIFLFNRSIAKRLIMAGASAHAPSNPDRDTPLHLAVKYDMPEIVEALVARGADPTARNKDNLTPLNHCKDNAEGAKLSEIMLKSPKAREALSGGDRSIKKEERAQPNSKERRRRLKEKAFAIARTGTLGENRRSRTS